MDEFFSLYQKLSGVGLGTLLFLILVGSRMRIWRWEQDFVDLKADYEKRLATVDQDRLRWQAIAMQASGIAENGLAIARQRTNPTGIT